MFRGGGVRWDRAGVRTRWTFKVDVTHFAPLPAGVTELPALLGCIAALAFAVKLFSLAGGGAVIITVRAALGRAATVG